MDNVTRHSLHLIRKQLEELDDFLLDGIRALTDRNDRLYVEVTMGEVLEQLDSLIDHSPRLTPQPVKESDYVCCS